MKLRGGLIWYVVHYIEVYYRLYYKVYGFTVYDMVRVSGFMTFACQDAELGV